jgi:hypothetical protein
VSVLQSLYAKMKDKPVRVGLATFWAKLGVQSDGAIVRFDDSATLAAIRRAITNGGIQRGRRAFLFLRPIAVFAGRVVGPSVIGLA